MVDDVDMVGSRQDGWLGVEMTRTGLTRTTPGINIAMQRDRRSQFASHERSDCGSGAKRAL